MAIPFQCTLSQLGEKLGTDAVGDTSRIIRGVASPAQGKADTLCVIWNERSLADLPADTPIVGKPEFFQDGRSGLSTPDPRAALPVLLKLFEPPRPQFKGIHPQACVDSEAHISPEAWIGPFCVVEAGAVIDAGAFLTSNVHVGTDVSIGKRTIVEPHAALMRGTQVGDDCILHSGCVLGCDGFGFIRHDGVIAKIPQIGGIIIGNDVEIGACTTIDRGTMGDTVIGDGTKIDNHVQIGHNVQVGRNCIICSMAGVAGSSTVEDDVTISAQAGVTDHVRIGKGAILGGRAGATNNIEASAVVSGFPARSHKEARRAQVLSLKLPDIYDRLKRLERLHPEIKAGKQKKETTD